MIGRHPLARRFPAVVTALTLFVGGTHFCLLSALASSLGARPMSCHGAGVEASPSHCCHDQAESAKPAPRLPGAPCCVALVIVAVPVLVAPSTHVSLLPCLDTVSERPAGLSAAAETPATDESPPPRVRARVLSPPRAPPLA